MKSFQIYKLGETVVISAVTDDGFSTVPTESMNTDVDAPASVITLTGWNLESSEARHEANQR